MTLHLDNFTDTGGTLIHNHTPDTSGNSYGTNAGMIIRSNRLAHESGTVRTSLINGVTVGSQYTIELDYYKFTNAGDLGVLFGNPTISGGDLGNGYLLRVSSTGVIELYFKVISFVLRGSYDPAESDGTALSQIKLTVDTTAPNIKVYYGGTEIIDYSPASMNSGGSIYLRGLGGATSSTGHHLDTLRIADGIPATAAPIISNQTATGITSTNVTVGYDTDQGEDNAYYLFDSVLSRSVGQYIKDNYTQTQAITATGTITESYTGAEGLKDGRKYFAHVVQENSFGFSNILSSDLFTIPTISNTYDEGVYSLTGGAAAPNGDSDTDTATLNVIDISPVAVSVTFTGQTSTFVRWIPTEPASIGFTGQVPELVTGLTVNAGDTDFAGQIPVLSGIDTVTISVPSGDLTLSGQIPVMTIGTTTFLSVPNGTLNLTNGTPTLEIIEPIGVTSTVCFDGTIEYLEYNGEIQDLEFNGTIKLRC